MSEGVITVTDGEGNIILRGHIRTLLLLGVFGQRLDLDPEKMRVFIDGKEVVKPESTEDDT